MFAQAIHANTMECYYSLSEQFLTQAEPSYCAITTLAMCFNALNLDPGIQWRKPWRWYTEEILGLCYPLHKIKENGITFSEFVALARCNGVSVEPHYADTVTANDLREKVKSVCIRPVADAYTTASSTDGSAVQQHTPSKRIIVASYSRKSLNQTGDGHMSPIGGYHEPSDHVLILDVARFKYPPYWVP
uniref:glutathione gamma-glutamylcysteinyltransferase n=1 Tax=Lygus hesperus TaxID=30085 RepID=A0A0A9Z1L9_LYGHE